MGSGGKFSLGHLRAAKLDPGQVLEIRRLYAEENWSQGRLAREFKMSVGQIGRIVRRESWQQYQHVSTDQEINDDAVRAEIAPAIPDEELVASMAKLTAKLNPTPAASKPTVGSAVNDMKSLWEGLQKRKAEIAEAETKEETRNDAEVRSDGGVDRGEDSGGGSSSSG